MTNSLPLSPGELSVRSDATGVVRKQPFSNNAKYRSIHPSNRALYPRDVFAFSGDDQ